ncbi:MAG: thiamine phosphate synthase, partial [Actinomycetota bacterium]
MREPHRLATYAVTAAMAGRTHLEVARAAIAGGATTVQLRAPELDPAARTRIASELAADCRAAGVLAIVNDDVEAARAAGAERIVGVGVGAPAGAAGAAPPRLGAERILGVCVGSPAEAAVAASAGADYLGVTVWATPTKPEARPAGLAGVAATDLPVVGIGGIDARNAART